MKKYSFVFFAFFLMIVQTGCSKRQKLMGSDDVLSKRENYVFDEKRILAIADLCDETASMLYDTTLSPIELDLKLSKLADTLQFAIRHCQDFEVNLWLRGFVRHNMQNILFNSRVNEDMKLTYLPIPYLWTVNRIDSTDYASTCMFGNTDEMYDRHTNILLASTGETRNCMFVFTNFLDTIIEDVSIAFFDTTGNYRILDPRDALYTDYQDVESGTLRVVFPLDTFLSLYDNAWMMDVLYRAKNEKIEMKQYISDSEKLFVNYIFQ